MTRSARLLRFVLLGSLGLGIPSASTAEARFSGHLKNFTIAQDAADNALLDEPITYLNQASARLMLDVFTENFVWQLHYELGANNRSRQQPVLPPGTQASRNGYRLSDLRTTIGPQDHQHEVIQNLDRLNVQWQTEAGDLTIGRQAITFGAARVINPTDVFLPFNVQTLNTEYRIGIDGVRFQSPIGQLGELDIGFVLGDGADSDTSAAFARLRGRVFEQDITASYIRFSGESLIGFGIESSVGEFGAWIETAYVTGEESYPRLSTGLDYALSENWFGLIEYHYNGAGIDKPENYLANSSTKPYTDGGVFLLGRHYLIPALSWQASPLLSMSFQGTLNLDDMSQFLSITGEYNLSDNTYLGLGYYRFVGDDLDISRAGLDLGSEYGNSPDIVFINLRYYF